MRLINMKINITFILTPLNFSLFVHIVMLYAPFPSIFNTFIWFELTDLNIDICILWFL